MRSMWFLAGLVAGAVLLSGVALASSGGRHFDLRFGDEAKIVGTPISCIANKTGSLCGPVERRSYCAAVVDGAFARIMCVTGNRARIAAQIAQP